MRVGEERLLRVTAFGRTGATTITWRTGPLLFSSCREAGGPAHRLATGSETHHQAELTAQRDCPSSEERRGGPINRHFWEPPADVSFPHRYFFQF